MGLSMSVHVCSVSKISNEPQFLMTLSGHNHLQLIRSLDSIQDVHHSWSKFIYIKTPIAASLTDIDLKLCLVLAERYPQHTFSANTSGDFSLFWGLLKHPSVLTAPLKI